YQSGQKMGAGNREHTRKGTWTFFNKNGSIYGIYYFDSSDFTVTGGQVYENGIKISESMPEKNCKQVVTRLGHTVKECEREAGGFASSLFKYSRDRDELQAILKMKTGFWIEYDKSGQKIGEGSYLGGRKDGVWNELVGGKWVKRSYMMGKIR
ncbi:MAG: hypothetical protein OEZ34_12510, partial [Spirochaetia bacterium]|nr:hypothetical protein [Spirochaetia bacterium]